MSRYTRGQRGRQRPCESARREYETCSRQPFRSPVVPPRPPASSGPSHGDELKNHLSSTSSSHPAPRYQALQHENVPYEREIYSSREILRRRPSGQTLEPDACRIQRGKGSVSSAASGYDSMESFRIQSSQRTHSSSSRGSGLPKTAS